MLIFWALPLGRVLESKKDITEETSSVSVDVFSMQSRFLGHAEIQEKPIFISRDRMYFVHADTEDNQYLTVTDYRIR